MQTVTVRFNHDSIEISAGAPLTAASLSMSHAEAASANDAGPTTPTKRFEDTNDGAAVLTWALEGHGIIMRSEWDAAPFVRSGQLEVLLDDYALPPADIYAVYPQKRNLPAKVRVFVDFLAARFEEKVVPQRASW